MHRLLAATALASALASQNASDNVTLLSRLNTKSGYSGIWGYESPDGREFALVGENNGLWIVEVTDPRNPHEIGYYPLPNNRWRECTSYGHYVYSVSEGHNGLQVVDMIDPESPRDLGRIVRALWSNAHTVSLDPDMGRIYVNGTSMGMQILDVKTDPEHPTLLGTYAQEFVHDSHHRRGKSYLSHYYSGTLRIVSNANPQSLTQLGILTTPGNLSHDAWVTDDDKILLTTDENSTPQPGFLQAWDISAPSIARKLGSYVVPGHIVHTVTILNRTAYVAWHGEGLQVIDISDPSNLKRIAYYDTSSQTTGLNGAWSSYPYFDSGTIVLTDIQEGLFAMRLEVGHMNRFGRTLPNSAGKAPRILLGGATPSVGASAATLEIVDLPPNQKFALAVSSNSANTTVGILTFYVDLSKAVVVSGTSDAKGKATIPIPIPAVPGLGRQKVWLQVLATDPSSLFGIVSSRGHSFGVAP